MKTVIVVGNYSIIIRQNWGVIRLCTRVGTELISLQSETGQNRSGCVLVGLNWLALQSEMRRQQTSGMSTRLRRFITDFHACDKSVTVAEADDYCNLSCRARIHQKDALARQGQPVVLDRLWRIKRGYGRRGARSSQLCGFCRRRVSRRSSGQHPNTRPCVVSGSGRGYLLGATLQPTRAPGRQARLPAPTGTPQRDASAAERVQRRRKTAQDYMDWLNGASRDIWRGFAGHESGPSRRQLLRRLVSAPAATSSVFLYWDVDNDGWTDRRQGIHGRSPVSGGRPKVDRAAGVSIVADAAGRRQQLGGKVNFITFLFVVHRGRQPFTTRVEFDDCSPLLTRLVRFLRTTSLPTDARQLTRVKSVSVTQPRW